MIVPASSGSDDKAEGAAITPRLFAIAEDATTGICAIVYRVYGVVVLDEERERIHGYVKRTVMETELLLTESERRRTAAKNAAKARWKFSRP